MATIPVVVFWILVFANKKGLQSRLSPELSSSHLCPHFCHSLLPSISLIIKKGQGWLLGSCKKVSKWVFQNIWPTGVHRCWIGAGRAWEQSRYVQEAWFYGHSRSGASRTLQSPRQQFSPVSWEKISCSCSMADKLCFFLSPVCFVLIPLAGHLPTLLAPTKCPSWSSPLQPLLLSDGHSNFIK